MSGDDKSNLEGPADGRYLVSEVLDRLEVDTTDLNRADKPGYCALDVGMLAQRRAKSDDLRCTLYCSSAWTALGTLVDPAES